MRKLVIMFAAGIYLTKFPATAIKSPISAKASLIARNVTLKEM